MTGSVGYNHKIGMSLSNLLKSMELSKIAELWGNINFQLKKIGLKKDLWI
ncbi:hypothetical protein [Candidatus Mesenet endosymbiont of Agriotes lineatus]